MGDLTIVNTAYPVAGLAPVFVSTSLLGHEVVDAGAETEAIGETVVAFVTTRDRLRWII